VQEGVGGYCSYGIGGGERVFLRQGLMKPIERPRDGSVPFLLFSGTVISNGAYANRA
jgi:hypothetical protein